VNMCQECIKWMELREDSGHDSAEAQ
jgi:hypothetical protein